MAISLSKHSTSKGRIAFRPVAPDDYPLLGRWMDQPHWRQWWGDPQTELGYIRDMVEGRDRTRPFIFELDGAPTGYIQYWHAADNLMEPWLSEAPWMKDLPPDSVGIDLSIGPAELLSRGVGSAALAELVARLRSEGYRTIIVDPDAANTRAIRAYEKAGFATYDRHEDETGVTLLMKHAA